MVKIEILNILYAIIIWQSFLFGFILITPKYRKVYRNRFLALILLTIGVQFTINILLSNNYIAEVPLNICSYGYLYGPLLYLYITFSLYKEALSKWVDLFHFSPFFFITVMSIFGFSICNIVSIFLLPTMLLYFIVAYRKVYIYKKTIPQVSTNSYNPELNWLLKLLIVSILNNVVGLIADVFSSITILGYYFHLSYVVLSCVLLFVNMVIFQGFKKPKIFQQITSNDIIIANSAKEKDSEESEITDYDNLILISRNLEILMTEAKTYLEPDLNLNLLAKELHVNPKTLSRAINRILKTNFSDYINTYRINESKRLLTETESSIKEVMYLVGFNSRSVFNTLFKKRTGFTPSEFRDHNSVN